MRRLDLVLENATGAMRISTDSGILERSQFWGEWGAPDLMERSQSGGRDAILRNEANFVSAPAFEVSSSSCLDVNSQSRRQRIKSLKPQAKNIVTARVSEGRPV